MCRDGSKFFGFLGVVSIYLLVGCGQPSEVYEEIKKLRGIGVNIDKPMVFPSTAELPQFITLTVYAALPKDETVKIENYEEDNSVFSPNVKGLTIDTGSEKYSPVANLNIYSVDARFAVPSDSELMLSARGGAVNLVYGFKLVSSSGEIEKMVGKVSVISPSGEDAKKTWTIPGVSIVSPSINGSIPSDTEVDIVADLANPNDEEVKFGWFSSEGRIQNRRALTTKWSTTSAAKQVLIATVRGKRSHAFAMKVLEFQTFEF